MKTKLTLFVAVLAVVLFGMGCASTDAQKKSDISRAFVINLIRIEYFEHSGTSADGKIYPFQIREVYKIQNTVPSDIISASYYPDNDILEIRRLQQAYWGIDEDGLLVRSWGGAADAKFRVKRRFLRPSDGGKSNVIEFTIDVQNSTKISRPPNSLSRIK